MKRLLGMGMGMGMVGCGGGDEDPPAGEAALQATVDEPPVQTVAADPNFGSESGSPATPPDTADDPSTQAADADAVAELEKLGAKIKRNHNDDVVEVRLTDTQISDAGLVHLNEMANLDFLDLDETKASAGQKAARRQEPGNR